MSSYDEHRAWMDREILKQQKDLNGMIAERDGYIDASNGFKCNGYASEYLNMRYELGWENGKVKLMVEGSCDVNR